MIKIAFADDHQALIDGVKMLLENTPNFEFIGAARNGIKMLKLIENNKIDVVITDLKMPDMDGFALTQKIKENFPEIKVIVFSMFDQPEAVKKASDAGADAYVLKTSSLDVLVLAIHKIVAGNTFYDQDISRDLKQATSSYLTHYYLQQNRKFLA